MSVPGRYFASEALSKHPGRLTRHGYHAHESERARHEALQRAAREHGWATVAKELNVLANVNENRPALHRIYRSDLKWIEQQHLHDYMSKELRRRMRE